MRARVTLGRFVDGDSLIHRLDPRVKVVLSVYGLIVCLMARTSGALLLLSVISIALMALTRLSAKTLVMSVRPILWFLLFAFVLNALTGQGEPLVRLGPLSVTADGLSTGAKALVRLSLLVIDTTVLMTLTTTPIGLADALERLLSPLKRLRFPVHETAMMMSIALRFVPTLVDEADTIMKAQSSRGANYDTGGLIARARGLMSILIPLFLSAFRRAEALATAMEARGYRGGEGRTRFRVLAIRRGDIIFGIIGVSLGVFVVLMPPWWP